MGQDRGAAQGVTDKQLWFRGMSAIMDEMNGLDIRNDYEHDENEEEKDRFRTSLEEEWRIHNKEELLSALEWIREGGHRVAFEQMRTFMNALSEADQWKCIHSLNPETGRYHEYLVVKTYMYKLPLPALQPGIGEDMPTCAARVHMSGLSQKWSQNN